MRKRKRVEIADVPRVSRSQSKTPIVKISEDGKFYCPKCKDRNYKISDYDSAPEGLRDLGSTLFIATCVCGATFQYVTYL